MFRIWEEKPDKPIFSQVLSHLVVANGGKTVIQVDLLSQGHCSDKLIKEIGETVKSKDKLDSLIFEKRKCEIETQKRK